MEWNTTPLHRQPKSIFERILSIFSSGSCFFRIVIFSVYPGSALVDTYRPLWRRMRLPQRFLYERYKCFLNNLSPVEESVLYWHSGVVAGRIIPRLCVPFVCGHTHTRASTLDRITKSSGDLEWGAPPLVSSRLDLYTPCPLHVFCSTSRSRIGL